MDYKNKIFISNALVRDLKSEEGERLLLTLTENRLLFLAYSQIKREQFDFEPLEIRVTDYCKFYCVSNGGKIKNEIASAIEFLKKTTFKVGKDRIRFLDDISELDKSKITLLLDDSLKKHLLNLEGNFTAFEIGFVAGFKSFYAQRLYTYLHTYMNSETPCRLGIDKVSKLFSDSKYNKAGELSNFVLKKVMNEINEKSDITFSFTQVKSLCNKTEFWFSTHKKSKEKLEETQFLWPDFESKTIYDDSGIDYYRVKDIDIIAYLEEYHPDLITYKNYVYCHPSHDSLHFYNTSRYHRFSDNTDGDLLDFLRKYADLTLEEIKAELEKNDYGFELVQRTAKKPTKVKRIKLPNRCDVNLPAIKSYLGERCISADMIDDFIDQGILYADNHKNCVFCNEEKICVIRATKENSSILKKTQVAEENNYFCFNYGGEFSNKIFVFESVIDLMSFLDYEQEQGYYVALAGLKDGALEKAIKDLNTTGEKDIVLCVDWDDAGRKFSKKYPEYKHIQQPAGFESCKDWNEFLIAFKNSY